MSESLNKNKSIFHNSLVNTANAIGNEKYFLNLDLRVIFDNQNRLKHV